MKHLLPILVAMFTLSLLAQTALASSSLEISNTSDFSILSTNFSGKETIYARIETDNDGKDLRVLNVRDNNYSVLKSYALNKEGNYFWAILSAPSQEGYYSLEARVESSDSTTTSVKTIKVGSPNNANVKVNVNSQVNGQNNSVDENESFESLKDIKQSQQPEPMEAVEVNEITDYYHDSNFKETRSVTQNLVLIAKQIIDFLWPF